LNFITYLLIHLRTIYAFTRRRCTERYWSNVSIAV